MLCKHFGVCGGCAIQDVPYEEQLILKRDLVRKQAYKHKIDLPEFQVEPSPRVFFYRNKVELTFSSGPEGEVFLGFHQRGQNRKVIDLRECLLFSERLPQLLNLLRDFAREHSLVPYDKYSHQGFLRYVVVKRTREEEYLLALVTSSQGQVLGEELAQRFSDLEWVETLYWVVHDGWGDAVGYDRVVHLKGTGYLVEDILGMRFVIGLRGFFQVNPWSTEILYGWVKDYVSNYVQGKVLDLYAGSGGIGLVLAKAGFEVLGIEMDDGAVGEAKQNVLLNGIKGYSMLKGNVRALLGLNPNWRGQFDCVIIDPPRSGMPPKVRYRVAKLGARNLVYISCNPLTFMADLKDLLSVYELVDFKAVDMFPHTPHVEVVAFLRRRQ